ncbi:concanavalin A-like lectin/glucanase domain-containing protein [Xylariaceae sp. FL0255]|nr:concanavalin A-like lectin/glucanase domain-containing protein [Xylariaceae sp. FL0255]
MGQEERPAINILSSEFVNPLNLVNIFTSTEGLILSYIPPLTGPCAPSYSLLSFLRFSLHNLALSPFHSSFLSLVTTHGSSDKMRFSALSALWLAATAWSAVDRTDEGNVRSISLRTHTLKQPYLDSDMASRWYEFGGDTVIRTDSYIRLSSEQQSQNGWLFSRVPLTATNWEIEVEFKIHGKSQLFGDGFAMWLTKEKGEPGPVFGHKDYFEGLGIFVDTYKNNRPGTVFPYVMAMFGDGKTGYVKDNDGKDQEFAGCSARGLRNPKVPSKLRLTYFQDKSLKLELQYKTEDDWQLCFESNDPPSIPSVTYLGFSAETGELSDNHEIISIEAKNLYTTGGGSGQGNMNAGGRSGRRGGKGRKQGGSWTWFLFKIALVFLAIGGGYVGYTAWRTNQKRSHRF